VRRLLHQRNGKKLKKAQPRLIADNEIDSYRMAVDIDRRKVNCSTKNGPGKMLDLD